MLATNGNVKFLLKFPLSLLFKVVYLFFLSFYLDFFVSGCLRVVPSSNLIGLHMEKVEFHIPFKIQQT
jgi:hypothetical protein